MDLSVIKSQIHAEHVKVVIAKGAEAVLYLEKWLGMEVLVKERPPKAYRRPELDFYIRKMRTVTEAKAMIKAAELGIPVPRIYDVDLDYMRIRMEYIREGVSMAYLINKDDPRILDFLRLFGKYVGLLHKTGILHGDPTPANVLIVKGGLRVIDFGLAEFLGSEPRPYDTKAIHKMAIDINVTLRSLEALRKDVANRLFEAFFEGYKEVVGPEMAERVKAMLRRIRSLVRYAVR